MFKIPRNNVIESSEGFSVEVLGRTGLEYRTDAKVIHLDSEIEAGPAGLVIFTKSSYSWTTADGSLITDEKEKREIIDNIREAFRFQGVEIAII
jgi:hypothetical protein